VLLGLGLKQEKRWNEGRNTDLEGEVNWRRTRFVGRRTRRETNWRDAVFVGEQISSFGGRESLLPWYYITFFVHYTLSLFHCLFFYIVTSGQCRRHKCLDVLILKRARA